MKNLLSLVFKKSSFGLLTLVCLSSLAVSQSYRGSIRGKVVDPHGAVISGAKISAKNVATGQSRQALSGKDGGYVLAELPAGAYVVSAEVSGLTPAAQNVIVNVGLDTTADFDLVTLEQRKEQVTVTSSAPLVDDTRDVLGEVVNERLVTELPLNGRDFGKLVALVPGATVEPSGVAAIQSGFGQFSINGSRDRSNNYTLDGTDNNDPFFNNSAFNQTGIGGAPASILPIDAIQEFNLQSQFNAEYGRNSGSVINIITKSGANVFHGSGFEFVRNDLFDARNYFNRSVDQSGDRIPKSEFRNNQFGASLGGPIVKDKTFFFGAYEGQRERVTSDFTFLVPTASQLSNAVAIAAAGTNGSNGSAPFTVGPNPALVSILGEFPAATGFNGSSGTVVGGVHDVNNVNSFIAKIDHQLSESEVLSGRYAFAQSKQQFPLGGLGFGAGSRLPQFSQTSPTRVQLVSLSLLSTLSPRKINEIRFGYSRYRTSFSSLDSSTNFSSPTLNFNTGASGLPEIDFSGQFDNLGAQAFSIPRGRSSQTFQILDNFTWVSGRHTIKLGGEFRRAMIDSFDDVLSHSLFSFGSEDATILAACPNAPGCDDGGTLTLVSYFLGDNFPSANSGNTHRTTYNNGFSFFVQDDFRVRPTFTVNAGLRWEYFGPISEAHNLLSNLGRDGNLAMVGTDGVDGAYQRDLNNFGPRLGFAWNFRSNTVVRGAYGIYYDYVPQDLLIANFTNSAGLTTNPIGPQPVISLSGSYDQTAFNGSNPVAGAPVFNAAVPPFQPDVFITPRNLVTPYMQNWNLNIEEGISQSLGLQLGYVGSKGSKLVRLRDANQPDIFGVRNTFPQYGFVDEFATISASTYNALQATLRTRNFHGLSGFVGYTWSKSLDDASDGIDFNFATVALPQNSNNLAAERGPSNFDTRHRFTAAYTYEIPRFAGPKRLSAGWQVNTIISAQSGRPVPVVNSDDTSGANFDVFPTPSNFHQRPNIVPGVSPINANWESGPDTIGYLNGNAFVDPPFGSFGNLSRNSIYGPHFWNVDFAVTKNTVLTERLTLQLRAEFFNIFNHPNFALPNFFVVPGSTQQGLITQTPDQAQTNPGLGGGGPRVVQLAAKINF